MNAIVVNNMEYIIGVPPSIGESRALRNSPVFMIYAIRAPCVNIMNEEVIRKFPMLFR